MTSATEKQTSSGSPPATSAAATPPSSTAQAPFDTLLLDCCQLLQAMHRNLQASTRVFRRLPQLREKFAPTVFLCALESVRSASGSATAAQLVDATKIAVVDSGKDAMGDEGEDSPAASAEGETEQSTADTTDAFAKLWAEEDTEGGGNDMRLFMACLALDVLLHKRQHQAAFPLAQALVNFVNAYEQQPLDRLSCIARSIHLTSRAYEAVRALSELRPWLLQLNRRAATAGNVEAQAASLNWAMRALLAEDEYQEAFTLAQRALWPSSLQGGPERCRWLLYMARIHAVRLDYADAYSKAQTALRQAPAGAKGFRLAAKQLAVVVHLLQGEVPARLLFLEEPRLLPYAQIVQAVRHGDVMRFRAELQTYKKRFQQDGNYLLVCRLEHNVTRIGLLRIATSYSHIPLSGLVAKLGLPSLEDARCVVTKAVADGLIDAIVDPDGVVVTREAAQQPGMTGPCKAFDERIAFCLQLYSDALQAMQYEETSKATALNSNDFDHNRAEQQEQLARAENEFDDDEF